jgi:hypothetical protein
MQAENVVLNVEPKWQALTKCWRHRPAVATASAWSETDDLRALYGEGVSIRDMKRRVAYYKIRRVGRNRSALTDALVAFEADPEQAAAVARRRSLWNAAALLKSDPYFAPLLLFDG